MYYRNINNTLKPCLSGQDQFKVIEIKRFHSSIKLRGVTHRKVHHNIYVSQTVSEWPFLALYIYIYIYLTNLIIFVNKLLSYFTWILDTGAFRLKQVDLVVSVLSISLVINNKHFLVQITYTTTLYAWLNSALLTPATVILLNRLYSTAELTVRASHQHNTLEREVDRVGGGEDWGKALELGLVINGPGLVWPHALAPFSGVGSTGVLNNLEILRRSVRLRYPVLAVRLNVFTNCWRVTRMRCIS